MPVTTWFQGASLKVAGIVILSLAILAGGCSNKTPSSTPTTSTPTVTPTSPLTQYQAAYRLLAAYPNYFWCDPDSYPIGRPELPIALAQFASIQANQPEFTAILDHLNLTAKSDYSDAEKLAIYQEHKKITLAVTLTPAAAGYDFTLRVDQNSGQTLRGAIAGNGAISILSTEASFNTCPICLARGTLIATPYGDVPVENLQVGQLVWTQDGAGNRLAAPVLKTSSTPVPAGFRILDIKLDDGREIRASAGHPSGELKALSEYQVGQMLSGGRITGIEQIDYDGGVTFDLRPAGHSGLYWAGGILMLSTLPDD